MTTAKIELPPKLIPVFTGDARYRGAYGGRGSAKTRSFALMSAVRAYMYSQSNISGMILCSREYMNSLEDSSMEEIKQAICETPWLAMHFDIGEKYIRTNNRLVEYGFCGLRQNLDSVKSKARILISWTDEGENVSEVAWQKLIPTVREDNSEIWVTWNPEAEGSPTDVRFRLKPPKNSKIIQLNHEDNPWFPEVLEATRLEDQENLDPNTYAWIWEGDYRKNSDAQIFANKFEVREFEIDASFDGPYQGLDFGFSQDPTAGVKTYVKDNVLYIEHESGKVGLELDDTADYVCARIPDFEKNTIRADSARPESISYLKRHGLPRIVGVEKGKGSVEDGIEHIKSYRKVVIHPRCKETAREFRMYSFKVDRLSGEVLTDIVDAFNHYIDAIRYALRPLMSRGKLNISKTLLEKIRS